MQSYIIRHPARQGCHTNSYCAFFPSLLPSPATLSCPAIYSPSPRLPFGLSPSSGSLLDFSPSVDFPLGFSPSSSLPFAFSPSSDVSLSMRCWLKPFFPFLMSGGRSKHCSKPTSPKMTRPKHNKQMFKWCNVWGCSATPEWDNRASLFQPFIGETPATGCNKRHKGCTGLH